MSRRLNETLQSVHWNLLLVDEEHDDRDEDTTEVGNDSLVSGDGEDKEPFSSSIGLAGLIF